MVNELLSNSYMAVTPDQRDKLAAGFVEIRMGPRADLGDIS